MDMDLPVKIGPYRVTGRLGRGGMGEVLRGHDDRLDRPVALKHILPDAREPETALRRFRREARAVARLSHPAIVQVYDWVEDEGQHWLIMELVEGCLLDEVISEGPLPPSRALEIARAPTRGRRPLPNRPPRSGRLGSPWWRPALKACGRRAGRR